MADPKRYTIPGLRPMLGLLDETTSSVVIPALTRRPPRELEHTLFALPTKMGAWAGNTQICCQCTMHHNKWPLHFYYCDHVVSQDPEYSYETVSQQIEAKAQIRQNIKERKSSEFSELVLWAPVSPTIESHWPGDKERVIMLADIPTSRRTWFHAPLRGLPWCTSPEMWLATL